MSAVSKSTVWLVLVGVFLTGAVAGGFISLRVVKTLVDRGRGPDQFSMRQMNRLVEGLQLTPEQQAQIKPIIDGTWKSLREYRHQSIDAMKGMESQIMAVLTPAQKDHYTDMQEKQRERWRHLQEQRKGAGGRDRDDRHGPPPLGPDGKPLPPPEGVLGDDPPPPPPLPE